MKPGHHTTGQHRRWRAAIDRPSIADHCASAGNVESSRLFLLQPTVHRYLIVFVASCALVVAARLTFASRGQLGRSLHAVMNSIHLRVVF